MNQSLDDYFNNEFISAHQCATKDLLNRLNVLLHESRHLMQTTASVLGSHKIIQVLEEEEANSEPCEVKRFCELLKTPIGDDDFEQLNRLLAHATQILKFDIYKDIERIDLELNKLYKWRKEHSLNGNTPNICDIREYLILPSALRRRAGIYARRIGELHHRFDQGIEHVNPDHLSPAIRRRYEHGFIDDYLRELTRWTHRDLAHLVQTHMKCQYPYEKLPLTFSYWEYDYTSRHSGFIGDFAHSQWTEWARNSRPYSEASFDEICTVKQSYWMTENSALHPILGHELAHRVIERIFGRDLHPQLVGKMSTSGKLGHLVMRMTDCLEAWLAPLNREWPNMRVEILCDLLAATRFGHAYLYAWFLEILENEHDSVQAIDSFGHFNICQENLKRIAANPMPFRSTPDDYIRGRALIAWLEIIGAENDPQAQELRSAVGSHLEILLLARLKNDPSEILFWKDMCNDLVHAITRSRAATGAKKYWNKFGFNTSTQETKHRFFTFLQGIGNQLRQIYQDQCPWLKSPNGTGTARGNIRTVTDIPWRIEWEENITQNGTSHNNTVENSPAARLFLTAMEEYLYRTANPDRILTMLRGEKTLAEHGKSNTLFPEAYFLMYNQSRKSSMYYLESDKQFYINDDRAFDERIRNLQLTLSYKEIKEQLVNNDCLYRLDLITILSPPRSEQNSLWHFNDPDSEWASSLRITPDHTDIILGRYDRYFFRACAEMDTPIYVNQTNKDGTRLPYTTRSRVLRRIGPQDDSSSHNKKPLAIILIGLKWSALRIPFISWLFKHDAAETLRQLYTDVFLSTGWEDIVLFINTDTHKEMFSQVNNLHDHPFIEDIETITTYQLFRDCLANTDTKDKNLREDGYRICYYVKTTDSKKQFLTDFRDNRSILIDAGISVDTTPYTQRTSSSEDDIYLYYASGLYDFGVFAPQLTWHQHQILHKFLFDMESVARLETSFRYMVYEDKDPETPS